MDTDNLYPLGAIVSARVNPGLSLKVTRYHEHIYYCASVEHPELHPYVYYERELGPAGRTIAQVPFMKLVSSEHGSGYFVHSIKGAANQ